MFVDHSQMKTNYYRQYSIYGCIILFVIFILCFPQSSKDDDLTIVNIRARNRDRSLFRPSYSNKDSSKHYFIQILAIIETSTNTSKYKHAIDSIQCYSQVQNYKFHVVNDSDFSYQCPHKDKFFRRHCVVAQLIHKTDYTLFIDADIGVVNPMRKIEEFIEEDKDIVFYDRFYSREVAAGSYLVKNSGWSKKFLEEYANYENHLPNSFHGTDNGALHIFLLKKLFPDRKDEYQPCIDLYDKSKDYSDLFAYESCCRAIMGIREDFGRVKILKRGTGWVRDNWLTNSKWSPSRDFMIHGWKVDQLQTYKTPPPINTDSRSSWYNPLSGAIDLKKCTSGNVTWNYDQNLIATERELEQQLHVQCIIEQKQHYDGLSIIKGILKRS